MTRLLLLNKPFDVLCQFTDAAGRTTLADLVRAPGLYPAGRLDRDSEGLVLLTDDGRLQQRLAHPAFKLPKRYLVQVDGEIGPSALAALGRGPVLRDGPTRTLEARRTEPPATLWDRHPPVRYRRQIPTSWIEIVIDAGRNRQVRRMTAAVGHPTLRLVRLAVGPFELGELAPGRTCEADPARLPDAPARARASRPPARDPRQRPSPGAGAARKTSPRRRPR